MGFFHKLILFLSDIFRMKCFWNFKTEMQHSWFVRSRSSRAIYEQWSDVFFAKRNKNKTQQKLSHQNKQAEFGHPTIKSFTISTLSQFLI